MKYKLEIILNQLQNYCVYADIVQFELHANIFIFFRTTIFKK